VGPKESIQNTRSRCTQVSNKFSSVLWVTNKVGVNSKHAIVFPISYGVSFVVFVISSQDTISIDILQKGISLNNKSGYQIECDTVFGFL